MEPYYSDKWRRIYYGDCREVLASGVGAGVSAVVTDPPYELGFMGKSWDSKGVSFHPVTWSIIRQSCKPGAMLLAFGGTRTFHRIAVAIEDAGWEIRDTVMWTYGSGFPKSMDISKAISKSNGTAEDARLWNGWGTALKPAWEPIILSMNPIDGTFAGNALKHDVAGLNINECRVGYLEGDDALEKGLKRAETPRADIRGGGFHTGTDWGEKRALVASGMTAKGRFPANLIHDGSDEVLAEFPITGGGGKPQQRERNMTNPVNFTSSSRPEYTPYPDTFNGGGSSARFFYCAKASRSERNSGGDSNNHPTVKPLALMEYLCKLVKMPQYNLILDPFCGSGSTLLACTAVGVHSVGIDSDEKSCDIVAARCSADTIKRIREGTY